MAAAAFWNMFPEWINPNNVGPENGPAATPILRMTRKVSYLCFGAAVALLVSAYVVLFTTNGSMRNKLHNMFGANDLGYGFAKSAIGAIFSLYIFILFLLAVKPNRNPIRFYRAVKFGVDVVILAGCTYLSETLGDAPSRVVAFLCILHILPAANLLCAYENVGLFDALLAVALEATLTAAKKHIDDGEALPLTYVFLICSVLQAAKHTNEYWRDYVKASLEAARAADIEADIEMGVGVQENVVVDAAAAAGGNAGDAAAAAGGNAGGAAAAGGNAGDAAAGGNAGGAAGAQGNNGVDAAAAAAGGNAGGAAGVQGNDGVDAAAAAAGGGGGDHGDNVAAGGGGGDHGDNVAAGRVNHP